MIDDQEETAEELSGKIQEYIAEFEPLLREQTELMTTVGRQRLGNTDQPRRRPVQRGRRPRLRTRADHRLPNHPLPPARKPEEDGECRADGCTEQMQVPPEHHHPVQERTQRPKLRPEQFEEMREELAELTDEELVFSAPTIREQSTRYTLEWAETNITRRREAVLQNPITTPVLEYCRY